MSGPMQKQVLILEDELLIALDLADRLGDHAIAVVGPARSCQAALDLLGSTRVDAAILDLVIGDERCDQVADALTARGIAWGLCTAYNRKALPARYQDALFVSKPFSDGDVERLLNDLLEQAAA